ncbi:inclusion body family protein [Caballeronia sp. SEWSISQ10-4 2]|uniref:AidA/PixA family protein n=1 Tax=Caballeronia sp. SEWSISQ10-4 2 TaxID=2937438 RepID=UPI00264F3049|nr:AidA/PixA family protein [Caballeronia sp. SEWSISQ10-4 2]MDN7183359.1 inclusion body family protein [Caballeronia sp. SEWSISQ10-4 2]
MSTEKTVKEKETSGRHIDVLVIVDAATLLSRYPGVGLSADTPTSIDGELIYVMAAGHVELLGRNDSHLDLIVPVGDDIHVRGNALALSGEHGVLFYDITLLDTDIVSAFRLDQVHGLTVPIPRADNLLQPDNQSVDDHFWRTQVLAHGTAACDLYFMVLDRGCTILGYFRWNLQIGTSR